MRKLFTLCLLVIGMIAGAQTQAKTKKQTIKSDTSTSFRQAPIAPLVYKAVVQLSGTNQPVVISVLENTLGQPVNFMRLSTGTYLVYTPNFLMGGNSISDNSRCIPKISVYNLGALSPDIIRFSFTGANNELQFNTYSTTSLPPAIVDLTRIIIVEFTVYVQ